MHIFMVFEQKLAFVTSLNVHISERYGFVFWNIFFIFAKTIKLTFGYDEEIFLHAGNGLHGLPAGCL